MGSTEIFEFCETSSKKQRTRLCFIMGSWYCVLFMWETSNTLAKYQNVGQEELRRPIKSRLRHQEELLPLCQTWSFRTATNVIQSQGDVAESSLTQAWWVQNHFGKMAQGWQIPQVFVRNWVDWGAGYSVWRACIGRPFLYCNKRGKNSKREKLGTLVEHRKKVFNQRPNFVEAKLELKRLHDEHVKETSEGNTPIHPVQRSRQRRSQQFEGLDGHDYQIDAQTGWRTYPSKSQGNLCGIQHFPLYQTNGNSTTIGSRTKVGILGDPHPGLNSSGFFSSEMLFRLPESELFLAIDGRGVDRYTCRTPHFHMYSHCTDHTAQMTCVHGSSLSWVSKKGHPSMRHVSPCAS